MQPFVAPRPTDEDAPALEIPAGAIDLGQAGSLRWIRADSPGEPWRAPTDEELEVAKRELPCVRMAKQALRRRIEREIGDDGDLIADQARQIESLTMLVTRLVAELWGGRTTDPAIKAAYISRAEAVVDAVDGGQLHLRGEYEDPAEMVARVTERSGHINRLAGEQYLPQRDALLGSDE